MKDKFLIGFSCIGFLFLIAFVYEADAREYKEQLPIEVSQMELTKQQLEKEIADLEQTKDSIKVETNTARYIITYEVQPSSNSLSFKDMIRAEDSEFTWSVYVDEQAFDSCEIGDITHIKAGYMDYNITVINKAIE